MGLLSRPSDEDSGEKTTRELTIVNRLGMHARPSALFVKVCNKFQSEIWVEKDGEQVNGKSIMGLMMLAAGQGSKLRVTCDGPDAEQALAEIAELIEKKFNEE